MVNETFSTRTLLDMSYHRLTLCLCILILPSLAIAQDNTFEEVNIGRHYTIPSEVLSQSRDVFVGLPDSYYHSSRSYPVIYHLDGAAQFAQTQTAAQSLSRAHRMDEAIVIGVGQNNRNKELGADGRESFREFLSDELRDWVSTNFRSNDYAILIGYSLGGSYTWYQTLKDADAFDSIISISPVLKREGLPSVSEIEEGLQKVGSKLNHVYMAKGNENLPFERPIKELEAVLDSTNYVKHLVTYFPNETHGSVPTPATYEAFQFIYDGWIMRRARDLSWLNSKARLELLGGIEAVVMYYNKLSEEIGYDLGIPDILWSRFAWTYLNEGHRDELIYLVQNHGKGHEAVLRYMFSNLIGKKDFVLAERLAQANVDNHPDSPHAWYQLAKVLKGQSKNDEARSAGDKAKSFLEEGHPLSTELLEFMTEL